jgi:hypothetical protein
VTAAAVALITAASAAVAEQSQNQQSQDDQPQSLVLKNVAQASHIFTLFFVVLAGVAPAFRSAFSAFLIL